MSEEKKLMEDIIDSRIVIMEECDLFFPITEIEYGLLGKILISMECYAQQEIEKVAPKWISVNDELPKSGFSCLVSDGKPYRRPFIQTIIMKDGFIKSAKMGVGLLGLKK